MTAQIIDFATRRTLAGAPQPKSLSIETMRYRHRALVEEVLTLPLDEFSPMVRYACLKVADHVENIIGARSDAIDPLAVSLRKLAKHLEWEKTLRTA